MRAKAAAREADRRLRRNHSHAVVIALAGRGGGTFGDEHPERLCEIPPIGSLARGPLLSSIWQCNWRVPALRRGSYAPVFMDK